MNVRLLISGLCFVLSILDGVLGDRDSLSTLAGGVEGLRGGCHACNGCCTTLGRCSLHCGWAWGILGGVVNKRHEGQLTNGVKGGPLGRAPLSIVEDNL